MGVVWNRDCMSARTQLCGLQIARAFLFGCQLCSRVDPGTVCVTPGIPLGPNRYRAPDTHASGFSLPRAQRQPLSQPWYVCSCSPMADLSLPAITRVSDFGRVRHPVSAAVSLKVHVDLPDATCEVSE